MMSNDQPLLVRDRSGRGIFIDERLPHHVTVHQRMFHTPANTLKGNAVKDF